MKKLQFSAILIALCIGFNALAQTPAPAGSTTSSTKTTKQQYKGEKEQWIDMYNKFKPKLDDLKSRVNKQEPNSDFAQNVNKLDQMAGDFRSKIDQYDAASPEEQAKMRPEMMKQKSDMEALYKTSKAQYDQMKGKSGSKPKTAEQAQPK